MTAEQKTTLEKWHRNIRCRHAAHYESANHFERLHLWFGIPVVVLSTVSGTTIFATLKQNGASVTAQITAGLLSVAAAVLASLQTFFRYSERAEKHRQAAVNYGPLSTELDTLLGFAETDQAALKTLVADFRVRWHRLDAESPTIPQKIWNRLSKEMGVGDTGIA